MKDLAFRVEDVRTWAKSRIEECQRQELKFGDAWNVRAVRTVGPPQALVEAWTERRTLQSVLKLLNGDAEEPNGNEERVK